MYILSECYIKYLLQKKLEPIHLSSSFSSQVPILIGQNIQMIFDWQKIGKILTFDWFKICLEKYYIEAIPKKTLDQWIFDRFLLHALTRLIRSGMDLLTYSKRQLHTLKSMRIQVQQQFPMLYFKPRTWQSSTAQISVSIKSYSSQIPYWSEKSEVSCDPTKIKWFCMIYV